MTTPSAASQPLRPWAHGGDARREEASDPRHPIQPVHRPAPLRQTVYEALADLIVGGNLLPGQHLIEGELARQLGVSRQPIREALHRLEAEGWVDLRPGQGAFVHIPTGYEVDRLFDVRSLLESEAARLAARAARADAVVRLRALLRDGADALAAGDPQRVVVANATLHAEITAQSGNPVLAELAGIVEWRMRWYHRPVALSRGRESWNEHKALIEAIERADQDRAGKIMRAHIEMTRDAYHRRPDAARTPPST